MHEKEREEVLLRALKYQMDDLKCEKRLGDLARASHAEELSRLRHRTRRIHRELEAAVHCLQTIGRAIVVHEKDEATSAEEKLAGIGRIVRWRMGGFVDEQLRCRGEAPEVAAQVDGCRTDLCRPIRPLSIDEVRRLGIPLAAAEKRD